MTAAVAGKIAIAVAIVGGLVAGGLFLIPRGDDPPAPPAPLSVAMQTMTGRDPALPISYDLQYPQVSGGADAAVRQRVNDALRAPADKRLKSIKDGVAEPSTLERVRQEGETVAMRSSARVLRQAPGLLSVRYDHDLDSAVLSHTTWRFPEALSVDLATGQVLGPRDVFRPEVLTAAGMRTLTQRLAPHTKNGFCTVPTVVGYPERRVSIDAAERPGGGDHVPAATFGFTDAGAEFEVLWYDLGCATAAGNETVVLPYGELADLLQPKVLTMLGTPVPAVSSAPPPTSARPGAGTYTNPRFGFTLPVPPGYTASSWVPENGEGTRFTNADLGATLTVWGTNSVGLRPAEKLAQVVASVTGDGGRVTFRSADENGYTASGYQGDGKIFYEHEAIGAGSAAGLRWVYAAENKAALDKPVTDTVEGFKPGDLSRPH
ncbi:hypothetical protein GTY80_41885 [Amycolatopsis sp. SID8362]|nr:hypothetical protein [Amycolatopsis sp. SID8362]NED46474.1 DUF4163 domain-containing protein [Amycolatopsis sp. SID8362]